jgi:hypothetical protein
VGAADFGRRHARGLGDGVDHDSRQGALPQVPGQQPEQELALALGCPADQASEQLAPPALRARAGQDADLPEDGVYLGQRQRGAGDRRGPDILAGQRRVPDADLALGQVSGQERDRDRNLVAGDPGEQAGDLVDLRAPAWLAGYRRGSSDDFGEEHTHDSPAALR